jgi:hypothetical protein
MKWATSACALRFHRQHFAVYVTFSSGPRQRLTANEGLTAETPRRSPWLAAV